MKFLILLLFFTLNAFAASGVNQNWSIAGNSTTSKNIVNGSFESGLTTGWTVGAGTLTATTAQAIQGVDSGLWTITGAGTIDLCATPTGLANTDMVASGWVKSTSTDLQVCSVVNSVENGCTPLGTVTGWKKVTASATYASGNFCFRLKSVASGAITAYVDDVKLEPLEFQQVSTVDQESMHFYGSGSTVITSVTTDIPFTTSSVYYDLNKLGTWTNNTTYTAKTAQKVVIKATARYTSSAQRNLQLFRNGIFTGITGDLITSTQQVLASPIALNVGDTLTIRAYDAATTGTLDTSVPAAHMISITATAVRDNVIASWQAPSDIGEIKYLPQNVAPQGFLPANGSIIGLSSGSHQGNTYYDLYNVLWNVAQTTAGEPYVISSAKGASASADWSAGKTIKIDESGLFTRAYLSGTSGAVGAKQLDAFQDHQHNADVWQGTPASGNASLQMATGKTGTSASAVGLSNTGRTSTETRPTNVAKYAFIRYATAQPTLLALPVSKENVFSAIISSTGAITSKNTDWINNVTLSGSSIFTIDITKLGLTKAPSIAGINVVPTTFGSSNSRNIVVESVSATSIVLKTGVTDANGVIVAAAIDFSIIIQKQGADYTPQGVFISNINPDGFNKTSGQVGLVESFSFSFGTTNATTVCSASPCSYLDQIGNNVTSVTRSGAGVYAANLSKTFTKLKCSMNVIKSANILVGDPITCSSCNSISFVSRLTTAVPDDAYGTVLCQGY